MYKRQINEVAPYSGIQLHPLSQEQNINNNKTETIVSQYKLVNLQGFKQRNCVFQCWRQFGLSCTQEEMVEK